MRVSSWRRMVKWTALAAMVPVVASCAAGAANGAGTVNAGASSLAGGAAGAGGAGSVEAAVQCNNVQAPAEPNLMAWDAASRASLGKLRSNGLLVVHYEANGCDVRLELLPQCNAEGTYRYSPYSAKREQRGVERQRSFCTIAHRRGEPCAEGGGRWRGANRFDGDGRGGRTGGNDGTRGGSSRRGLRPGDACDRSDVRRWIRAQRGERAADRSLGKSLRCVVVARVGVIVVTRNVGVERGSVRRRAVHRCSCSRPREMRMPAGVRKRAERRTPACNVPLRVALLRIAADGSGAGGTGGIGAAGTAANVGAITGATAPRSSVAAPTVAPSTVCLPPHGPSVPPAAAVPAIGVDTGDRDGDGIANAMDACPDDAGPRDADPKIAGCPQVFLRGANLVVLHPPTFETGSAKLAPESADVLTAVANVLKRHLDIQHLAIEVYTAPSADPGLSQRRANAVRSWLRFARRDRSLAA